MITKIAAALVAGDYILSCVQYPHIKGTIKAVNCFKEQFANPWTDTSNQNAANWKGAIIRARNPLGSSHKMKTSVIPPDLEDARAAAEEVENTYLEDGYTLSVTIKTGFGNYTIPGDTEFQVVGTEAMARAA